MYTVSSFADHYVAFPHSEWLRERERERDLEISIQLLLKLEMSLLYALSFLETKLKIVNCLTKIFFLF